MNAKLHPLDPNQRRAVDPRDSVWLSASAGTGKTQVLSARVLRLLLATESGRSVRPDQILCLTFTKAGATEMATRINDTLARWVRLDDARLAEDLQAIGADIGAAARAHARTLFAAVLDCPGGGLRIDTIHAFAQWLLAAFPEEAGLIPGARPMEDRERTLLARQVLGDLLVSAEARGDAATADALAGLSLRLGPDAVESWLLRCASAYDAWFGAGAWQPPMAAAVHRLLGLPADADADGLALHCGDDVFDTPSLRRCLAANRQWQAKTGQDRAEIIEWWLDQEAGERLDRIDDLHQVFFTQKGDPRVATAAVKFHDAYYEDVERIGACIAAVRARRALLDLAGWLAPALELGRAFALAWDEAKAREGLIDFDDQIRRAADLLHRSDMADWIRYKLDRRFDHILVDEAQDTNAAQWRIITALTEDFFAGQGARGDVVRTLFVVGDYKQAIFGFQGTSPENFRSAQQSFRTALADAATNAQALREGPDLRKLQELGLDRSFRTARPVLNFVDRAIEQVGFAGFGLAQQPEPHVGEERPGYVALWRPVGQRAEDAPGGELADDGADVDEDGEEGWLGQSDRELAERLAQQIKQWVDPLNRGFRLFKGVKDGDPPRRAKPGEIMVLVRKRGALAALIVARLHAAGVPVAGVDRLRLGAPLAVRDLVAALRFAAQPLDDLNLASLLVSPLIGWTQEQLLAHGWRTKGVHLWEHLRQLAAPDVATTMAQLGDLLGRADFEPVQALLHWLLVGPWDGRRRLVARLGREANDPIDELLNAANAFAATATPSLVGFLAWFDAGEGELKRESGGSADLVRVMTVHGAKGLQAPIVILADATGNPEAGRGGSIALTDPIADAFGDEPRRVPMPPLGKAERLGRIAEAADALARAESEEHWRLLYVAMTRAEEALFVTGALSAREKVPAPGSWYARLAEVPQVEDDAVDWVSDPIWGGRRDHGAMPVMPPVAPVSAELPLPPALPGWLTRDVGAEPRPPRPLAPSALGEDDAPDPPLIAGGDSGALAAAGRRGTLIHRLLERLPAVAPDRRQDAARRWLARQAGDLAEAAQREIAASALAVIADPRWAELFAPDALAEVPIAALVGTRMVAGTIDRLLIGASRIRLVDFKTARRPPASLADVPVATLRQIAAYAAALAGTYPGRTVEAALLYTQTPALIEIPAATLAEHKLALLATQESLGA